MENIIIQKNDGNICIRHNNKEIESYSITKAVDFKLLIKYLINDELKNKFTLVIPDCLELTDEENALVKIISSILENYNAKIDDFNEFLKLNNYSL